MENSRKPIFVVDDALFVTSLIEKIRRDLGFSEIQACSEESDCVSMIHQDPAVVLLDYQMDHLDGLTVLKKSNRTDKI